MKDNHKNVDDILDSAIDRIRSERIDEPAADAAAGRVWNRISAEAAGIEDGSVVPLGAMNPAGGSGDCAVFRALMPEHRDGTISPAKAMLLDDHVSECARCRIALHEPETAAPAATVSSRPTGREAPRAWWASRPVWALAATFAIVAVLSVGGLTSGAFDIPVAGELRISELDEGLLRMDGDELVAVAAGETIAFGETLRTSKGAGAVLTLDDGSRLEMNDRSELSVKRGWWNGTTVELERGAVIVEAADQGSGQLRVASADCITTVTGTVFSVNAGMKGSRVSVLEGEVEVDHGGRHEVLGPGDQVSTNPILGSVPLDEEIAWSRDIDRHLALFAELSEIRRAFNRNVGQLGLRTTSRLIHLVPEDTTIFVAMPNIGSALEESHRTLVERMESNPMLREWWTTQADAQEFRNGMGLAVDKLSRISEFVGDEIVVAVGFDSQKGPNVPIFIAELKNAGSFRPFMEQQMAELNEEAGHEAIRFTDDPVADAAGPDGGNTDRLLMHVDDTCLIASPSALRIAEVKDRLAGATDGGFMSTPFFGAIEDSYRKGAGWVFGIDVERIMRTAVEETNDPGERTALERTGLLDARHFIVERRDLPSGTDQRAVLTFGSERQGLTSWLAEPAPMGSLRFISPDASFAAAFVLKEPADVLDDLFGMIEPSDPAFRDDLFEFESETGISIRDDIAAALGGEFSFAMDGPILPTPSWKVVFEVYDPASLQEAIQQLVQNFNREAEKNQGEERLVIESTTVSGQPAWAIGVEGKSFRIHYLFEDGYLVTSQSEALLDRAVRNARAGLSLSGSPKFLSLLPQDGHAHASAVIYQDARSALGALSGAVDRIATEELTPELREAVAKLAADTPPSLGLAWAGPDRISFAVSGEGDPIGSQLFSMMGMAGLKDLHSSIEEIAKQHHPDNEDATQHSVNP